MPSAGEALDYSCLLCGVIGCCLPFLFAQPLPLPGAAYQGVYDGHPHEGEEAVHENVELVQILDANQVSNLRRT